jgi:hypothetical protein
MHTLYALIVINLKLIKRFGFGVAGGGLDMVEADERNEREAHEADANESLNKNIEYIKREANETSEAIEKEVAKLRDPTVHAALMYATVREKENTNRILKTINAKLDVLEEKIRLLEKKTVKLGKGQPHAEVQMLADVDQKIIDFIKAKGPTAAETIQKEFGYKGRNAACARLSRLHQLGRLAKQRAGKTIYYIHAAQR